MKVAEKNISLLPNVFKNLSDSVAILDSDMNIVYCNIAFGKLYSHCISDRLNVPFLSSQVVLFRSSELDEFCVDHVFNNIAVQSILSELEGYDDELIMLISKKSYNGKSFESKVNESLAKASRELISPSLSIDTIARIVFKACIELTNSATGFVAFDDPMSENILVHYFTDAYVGSHDVVGNIQFIHRDDYLLKGLLGHELNATVPVIKNNIELKVLKSLGINSTSVIKNYLAYPAIVDNVFMGQIVLFNSPRGFTQQSVDVICSLSNVYGLAVFRQRMEWELIAAKDKAEESDRLKTAFLANMSHEIRTPMNAIVGFSQLITMASCAQEKRMEFSKLIHSSCDDLLKLVTEIIDLSKIESHQMILYPTSFFVEDVLTEQLNLFKDKGSAAGKNVNFILKTTDSTISIMTDKDRLRQIVGNLLDNALKFTDSGSVTLYYELEGENLIHITVKDTGIGIPYEKQKRIFESFRQLEVAMKRNFGGTGLGLSIVKNLTELMGGQVSLDSKPNRGSNFKISLPIYQFSASRKNNGIKNKISRSVIKNKKILVVEDEPRNAKFLELLLMAEKAKIKIMYNGKQAVQWVKENTPDLILMDVRMPVMNGIDATRLIKQDFPEVPIIAQTAYAMKEDEDLCMEAGCDAFIAKPVNKEVLLDLIAEKLA